MSKSYPIYHEFQINEPPIGHVEIYENGKDLFSVNFISDICAAYFAEPKPNGKLIYFGLCARPVINPFIKKKPELNKLQKFVCKVFKIKL